MWQQAALVSQALIDKLQTIERYNHRTKRCCVLSQNDGTSSSDRRAIKPATSGKTRQCVDRSPWPIGDGARTIPTDPEGPQKHPRPGKKGPNSGTGFLCRGSPCDDKGKGDVDESFDEAAAVSFRAHHQQRGVRHHDRDPAPRIEVRPGLLGCTEPKIVLVGPSVEEEALSMSIAVRRCGSNPRSPMRDPAH
jgi:hypothetical protein